MDDLNELRVCLTRAVVIINTLADKIKLTNEQQDHIWYNIEKDQLFIAPFTPTNYTIKDLYFFNISFWDRCTYIDEL